MISPDIPGRSNLDSATVVVTGLTGFVGKRLQQHLVNAFTEVRAIVRPGRSHSGLHPDIAVVEAALNDTSLIQQAFQDADYVIHLAGTVRGASFADFKLANVDAVESICQAISVQDSPPSLLLVSSIVASQPDLSDYSASKFAGEQVLDSYPDINWAILRPPAIYGPGDKEMLPLLQWMRRGLTIVPGNAEQRLAFMYVDDVVSAIMAWPEHSEGCKHQYFTLDDGEPNGYSWPAISQAVAGKETKLTVVPVSLLEIFAKMNRFFAGLFSYSPMLTPGKVKELTHSCWVGDNQLFSQLTGWQPKFNLAQGANEMFSAL